MARKSTFITTREPLRRIKMFEEESDQKYTYASLCRIEEIVKTSMEEESRRYSNKKKRFKYYDAVLKIANDLKSIYYTDDLEFHERLIVKNVSDLEKI